MSLGDQLKINENRQRKNYLAKFKLNVCQKKNVQNKFFKLVLIFINKIID